MRTKFKPWALPYLKENNDIAKTKFDKKDKFYKSIEIEVGGGKGDFIIGLALKNPKTHYLMIEKVISVAAPAVKKIKEKEITNIRVIYDDFINIVRDIPSSSINRIYLNFSDPWPKKKHAKRRLTASSFLNDYHRILKKDGEIRFKTDQSILYEFTKNNIDNKKFNIILDNSNYNEISIDDVMSEYEAKFRKENKRIYRLIIKKL